MKRIKPLFALFIKRHIQIDTHAFMPVHAKCAWKCVCVIYDVCLCAFVCIYDSNTMKFVNKNQYLIFVIRDS